MVVLCDLGIELDRICIILFSFILQCVINVINFSPTFCSIWYGTCLAAGRRRNKIAQLSLTNPRDAKACQKLLQFDVLTTSSLTILVYLHSFSCCCVRNLRNPAKFTENSNLWSSRSSKVIDLGVNRNPMYDFLLVTNSNVAAAQLQTGCPRP